MSSEKKDEVVLDVKINFLPIYGGFDHLNKYLSSLDLYNNLPSEKKKEINKKFTVALKKANELENSVTNYFTE